MAMTDGQWTTYNEAAVRLGISSDAVRRRAARGHWARVRGNDGLARIQVPDDVSAPRRGDVQGDTTTLVSSLEAHIATLKTEIDRLTAELAGEKERSDREVERLEASLVTERERGDRVAADLAGERAEHQEQLAAAMAQLVELARRMAAIAETKTAEAEPEPTRRKLGRAWGWFLRN